MRLLTSKTYIIGTGRCGTDSLAQKLNGLHEPDPDIIREATEFYLGNPEVNEILVNKLKKRKQLKTNVIVDHKQSTVIPVIRAVDPKSEFVLLVREPMACIESFYARETYSDAEGEKRKSI